MVKRMKVTCLPEILGYMVVAAGTSCHVRPCRGVRRCMYSAKFKSHNSMSMNLKYVANAHLNFSDF
jgi:hypothetical protein